MSDLEATVVCRFCKTEGHEIGECDEAYEQWLRDENAKREALEDALRIDSYLDDAAVHASEQAAEEVADAAAEAAAEAKAHEPRYPEGKDPTENDNPQPIKSVAKKHGEFDRGDHTELAQRLLAKLKDKGPAVVYDDGSLHKYEPGDGIWHPIDSGALSCTVQSFAGSALAGERKKTLRVGSGDVRGAISLACDQARSIGFFTHTAKGVVFSNGFVTVTGAGCVCQEHNSANRARWGYTFPFVEDAKPAMFLKFLDSVFRDDEDKAIKIQFVQEFMGIALLGLAPAFSHCLVATSFLNAETDGQNGKSQLALVIQSIMPRGTVASTRPQDFDNEYRRAGLAGKLLNSVGEMPEGDILDSASFKSIITGDCIEGRHIREAPFSFYPMAAHYYACNQPPGTGDFTRAFFRRFIFLTFSRVFRETDPDFVLDIGKKIVAAEKEIIPSWALQGVVRALKQRRYTIPPSSELAIKRWREKVDQVALFTNECTTPARSEKPGRKSDWTKAHSVYNRYQEWARDTGRKMPLISDHFAERMKQLGKGSKRVTDGYFYPVKLV